MIVDVHVHLVGMNRENGCRVSAKLSSGVVFHLLRLALGLRGVERGALDRAYREKLVGWVHDSDVEAVGLLALDGVYDDAGRLDERTHLLVSNDYLFDVASISEQLLPIASINPQRRDALDELDRVSELGAVAIKTLPNSQVFDPADKRYRPFWQRMADLEMPLLTHTSFEHTIPAYVQEYGEPQRLVGPLAEGVLVIAAHCASSGIAHRKEDIDVWLQMLREWPNLYGDISAMTSVARFPYIWRVLRDEVAPDRICLGSDFPIPVSPMLFVTRLGFAKARRLSRIANPIQRNYETFRELGVPDPVLERGASLLRL